MDQVCQEFCVAYFDESPLGGFSYFLGKMMPAHSGNRTESWEQYLSQF